MKHLQHFILTESLSSSPEQAFMDEYYTLTKGLRTSDPDKENYRFYKPDCGYENYFDNPSKLAGYVTLDIKPKRLTPHFFEDGTIDGNLTEPLDTIYVSMVKVAHMDRTQGLATACMKDLLKLADKHGVIMALYPMPFDETSSAYSTKNTVQQLHAWYQKLGFVDIDDEECSDMLRHPQR